MAPENSTEPSEGMPSIDTDSVSRKSVGSVSKFGHSMPRALIRIGSHDGHWKLAPVAEPTERNTPKPGRVSNVPSPRMAKFLASPPSSRLPILTVAATCRNSTIASVAPAPVFRRNPTARTSMKSLILSSSVSTSNTKPVTRPSSKSSCRRSASVSGCPSSRRSSAVRRSVIVAEIGRPGKSLAPPEAMAMEPSKLIAAPTVKLKFSTMKRMSSNSRMLPNVIFACAVGDVAACTGGAAWPGVGVAVGARSWAAVQP